MPSPEETLLPEGEINRDIQPEQGMQYETGVRLNLFEGFTRLEATLYRIDLRNLLVTKRITEDIFIGINAGRTRHSGLELMLQQQLFRQQVGKQFIDDANSVVNDAYLLTGLKASRLILLGIASSVELYTGINNLTNSHYASMLTVNAVAFGNSEPRYYYPGMSRHFYTGIRWSF